LPPLPNTDDLDVSPESESYDCVDEILSLFRANVLFRNFEINGPADRMLIYGTLFISECLGKVKPTMNAREAEKVGHLCWGRALAEPNLTPPPF
jgi:actin related protein 2/3 complex subunit 3